MKTNLIGMILNNAGRRCFEGIVLDDGGNPLSAADSLHTMIMEYAKVFNGGSSNMVATSREVTCLPASPASTPEAQPDQNAPVLAKEPMTHEARRYCHGDEAWTNWQPCTAEQARRYTADDGFQIRTRPEAP